MDRDSNLDIDLGQIEDNPLQNEAPEASEVTIFDNQNLEPGERTVKKQS